MKINFSRKTRLRFNNIILTLSQIPSNHLKISYNILCCNFWLKKKLYEVSLKLDFKVATLRILENEK